MFNCGEYGFDKLLAKSSNTSITLSVYDFNDPFFDKNPYISIFPFFSNFLYLTFWVLFFFTLLKLNLSFFNEFTILKKELRNSFSIESFGSCIIYIYSTTLVQV